MKWKTRLRNSLAHPRGLAHRELRRVVAIVGSRLRGRLLDVGCGSKPYADLLSGADSYVALETAATMHGLDRVDVLGTALSLPFHGCRLGRVLCAQALEPIADHL